MADCIRIQQSLKALCCDGNSVSGQATVALKGNNGACQLYDPDDGTWLTPGTIGIFTVGSEVADSWITCPLPCLDQIEGPGGESAFDLGFYYEIKVFVSGEKTCTYSVGLDCNGLGLVANQIASLEDVIILSPITSNPNPNDFFVQQYETTTSLVSNGDNTYTYTNEDGVETTFSTSTGGGGGITQTITTLVDNGNGTFTYTNEQGDMVTVNYGGAETVTTLTNSGRTYTYTNESGATKTFDGGAQTITTLTDNGNKTFTYTNEAGTPVVVNFADVISTLVDNSDGTFTYTNEVGAAVTFDGSSCSPFEDVLCDSADNYAPVYVTGIIDPTDGTFRAGPVYTNADGTSYTGLLSTLGVCSGGGTGGSSAPFNCSDLNSCDVEALANVSVTGRANGYVLAWSTASNSYMPTAPSILSETATTLVDNNDGTFTYTNEANVQTTFKTVDKEKISFTSDSLVTYPSSSSIDIDAVNRQFYAYAVTVATPPTGDETFSLVDVSNSATIAAGTLSNGSLTTGIISVTPYDLNSGALLQANILTANGSEKFTLYAFYSTTTSELGSS